MLVTMKTIIFHALQLFDSTKPLTATPVASSARPFLFFGCFCFNLFCFTLFCLVLPFVEEKAGF